MHNVLRAVFKPGTFHVNPGAAPSSSAVQDPVKVVLYLLDLVVDLPGFPDGDPGRHHPGPAPGRRPPEGAAETSGVRRAADRLRFLQTHEPCPGDPDHGGGRLFPEAGLRRGHVPLDTERGMLRAV